MTRRSLFRATMLFSSSRSASVYSRPKISNNSLIRDKKSNKHIANGYKKLVHTFKREAVQFFVAKNLAINQWPLEAFPAVQTWTTNCKRDRKAVVTWHFAVCGWQFPMKNRMLKVPTVPLYSERVYLIITEHVCVTVAPLTVELDLYVESFANIAEANMVSHVISILGYEFTFLVM